MTHSHNHRSISGLARAAARTRPATLAAALVLVLAPGATPARAADFVPGQVIVGYAKGPLDAVAADTVRRMGVRRSSDTGDPLTRVVKLPPGISVRRALARLRGQPGVAYAVPDYIAHADGVWIPNDRGRSHQAGGWRKLQWNFLAKTGVDVPRAWANLRADRRPGGKGVVIAVLDTGVAYRDWRRFRRSPDFSRTKFVDPHDFVSGNRFPLDREGHGTFVTGVIAESTNNRIGLTGIAYGASIMPVRVLDAIGSGAAATIAKGIRYAVKHHAQVINLSLEFTPDVTAADIPDILNAIRYAYRRGVVVVAASGNDYAGQVAYPARAPTVISVGATTRDRCLASYSNGGAGLALVAPGGGRDKAISGDPDCHPNRALPPIFQTTFPDPNNPQRFTIPNDMLGTSMSTPHVAAAAALVIASRASGRHPTPDQVRERLEFTARPLGSTHPNTDFGFGLVDAGLATARPSQQRKPK